MASLMAHRGCLALSHSLQASQRCKALRRHVFLQSQTAAPGAAQTVPGRNISLLACFRPESRSGPVAVRVGPSCHHQLGRVVIPIRVRGLQCPLTWAPAPWILMNCSELGLWHLCALTVPDSCHGVWRCIQGENPGLSQSLAPGSTSI